MRDEPIDTIWVCVDCLMHAANGECGSCHDGPHDMEPLGAIGDGYSVTPGMTYEDHEDDCLIRGGRDNAPDDYECECEHNSFSTSQCEGCGSWLHGKREAMTLWRVEGS